MTSDHRATSSDASALSTTEPNATTERPEWTEVRVDVPEGWGELVADVLAIGPCTSVVFGTTSIAAEPPPAGYEVVRSFVSTLHDTPALRADVTAALASLVATTGSPELAGLAPRFRPVPPEDWATSWKKAWKPFRVGRFVLLPPWREAPPPRSTDQRLTLQPGGAFGSGRHASTRTVLRAMQPIVRPGDRVLDAGSGSGVLSVAACLLGARSAFGFDIDPMSVPEGEQLAAWNSVQDRCRFVVGDFGCLNAEHSDFDVVFANIYADVLQAHAADLAARLRPGGAFLFSGCRFDHVEATRPALAAAGLEIEAELPRGRWWTFMGRRR